MPAHLHPTREAGRAFATRGLEGPIDMLNLLRFRDVADYSATPELAGDGPVSGAAAYRRYLAHAAPFLEAAGGELVWKARGGDALIGPADERWDLVLLVRHRDPSAFLAFANDAAYLAGLGHRTAALEDSRLIPLQPA